MPSIWRWSHHMRELITWGPFCKFPFLRCLFACFVYASMCSALLRVASLRTAFFVIPFYVLPVCVMPFCVLHLCVMPFSVLALCVMPLCVMPFALCLFACCLFACSLSAWCFLPWCLFLRDTYMIVALLVFLPFTVVFFTNFDSVYFRFDLNLSTFRLLNFVIDIPSYKYSFYVRFEDRKLALQQRKKTQMKLFSFVTTYHPAVCGLKEILMNKCLACVYRVMDARGKFEEHERCVRVARGDSRVQL